MSLFYTINPKGTIAISNYRLGKYVQSLGFAKYYLSDEKTITPIYIYKTGNIIEPVAPIRVHETVVKELETRAGSTGYIPAEELPRVVDKLVESRILTSQELLITMDELDRPIISDTKDSAIIPFRNGVVTITHEDILFTPIDFYDGYFWASQIIDRNFEPLSFEETQNSDFYSLMYNVTATRNPMGWCRNEERFISLLSLLGYMLHSYKDPTNPRAVILMDESVDGVAMGRTCKGLIVFAIGTLRKVITLDGKCFNENDRFNYNRVSLDTRILFIDDVGKDFNFEKFFSIVTEGIKIEEKYAKSFYIPFNQSPKIIISTNYSLHGMGSSHEARKYEFALSNYYSSTFTPIDEFGRMFFYEWDTTQWNYFDNLMLYALQYYLTDGVTLVTDSNIRQKKLITETSQEFVDWISEQVFAPGTKYTTTEIYGRYESQTGFKVDPKVFVGYLRAYAALNNCSLELPHSGVKRYFEFKPR